MSERSFHLLTYELSIETNHYYGSQDLGQPSVNFR
jgi:hypothetical protein